MIETPGQSSQPRYPVFWVRLDEIGYFCQSPEHDDPDNQKKHQRWEERLVSGDRSQGGAKFLATAAIFDDIGSTKLREPLIIGQSRNYKYYVGTGNRALTCLRAFEKLGLLETTILGLGRNPEGGVLIPTYLMHPEDIWGDGTRTRFIQKREGYDE